MNYFYFTLKPHGVLWGELPADHHEYGIAAADGQRMNPGGHTMGAEEAQQLRGQGYPLFFHTCSLEKRWEGKVESKDKIRQQGWYRVAGLVQTYCLIPENTVCPQLCWYNCLLVLNQ